MGRAPCCEKMGLKKGPWTPEEDEILINYIRLHGHSNWRALPKLAGLSRCGKSCRLRWTNYLRPDIKRGNFTQEEEETIIKLHEMLGNRWSAIAAKLPGRTDNEIKNVWHTHLKKRLPNPDPNWPHSDVSEPARKRARKPKVAKKVLAPMKTEPEHVDCMESRNDEDDYNKNNNDHNSNNDEGNIARPTSQVKNEPVSPQPCTSEMSTVTSTSSTGASENDNRSKEIVGGYFGDFTDISDDFWMEVLSVEDTAMSTDHQEHLPGISRADPNTLSDHFLTEPVFKFESNGDGDEMEFFWNNLLTRPSNELPEFSEIAL